MGERLKARRGPPAPLHVCRVCGFTDTTPSPWSGSQQGNHTLCRVCAELQAVLVEALRIEHRVRRRELVGQTGLVPLNALLNRADELLEEDLDEIRALHALTDLEDLSAIRVYRRLGERRVELDFLPKLGRLARAALSTLPATVPRRQARHPRPAHG